MLFDNSTVCLVLFSPFYQNEFLIVTKALFVKHLRFKVVVAFIVNGGYISYQKSLEDGLGFCDLPVWFILKVSLGLC